ncbi:MAG: hypothetical protein OEZ34_03720 [Spirochaetia bacterium]|nr:hypothetical protein [Spirochaetia bacterium]
MMKTVPLDFSYEQSQHLNTMQNMLRLMDEKSLIEYQKKYPTITQDGPLKEFDSNSDSPLL